MANQPWYVESNRLAQENKILKELMISMADPLPPDGDTGRHKPDPNAPGSPKTTGPSASTDPLIA